MLLAFGYLLVAGELGARTDRAEPEESAELEDFIVYADPQIFDALRKRPFSKRDPVVEQFFHTLPGITESVYLTNLSAMQAYLDSIKSGRLDKMNRLAALAGLDQAPQGLLDGYQDRIKTMETLMTWMKKQKPVKLLQLDIWKESDLRYRLARVPLENIRINPDTNELESRLLFDWKMIFQHRPRAMDLKLDFKMGIHLQNLTGFYDPRGFLHWSELRLKDLNGVEVAYPIIITEALTQNMAAEMPAHEAAYKTTIESFYHILREFFFSDLADMHTLYILTRGRIFADEWHQYQSTPLLRGLAAHLVFQALEGQLGSVKAKEILENDWTTWHLRKIGSEFNSITWENERGPDFGYRSYKQKPELRNIYWSTQFVQYLVQRYSPTFVPDMCKALKSQSSNKKQKLSEAELFRNLTGDDLTEVIQTFLDRNSAN